MRSSATTYQGIPYERGATQVSTGNTAGCRFQRPSHGVEGALRQSQPAIAGFDRFAVCPASHLVFLTQPAAAPMGQGRTQASQLDAATGTASHTQAPYIYRQPDRRKRRLDPDEVREGRRGAITS